MIRLCVPIVCLREHAVLPTVESNLTPPVSPSGVAKLVYKSLVMLLGVHLWGSGHRSQEPQRIRARSKTGHGHSQVHQESTDRHPDRRLRRCETDQRLHLR